VNWFEVDRAGLAKLLERRGKSFIVFELLQNAWDENTQRVDVELERLPNSPYARLTVTDDNPDGFLDLRDAFTLFAESKKKGDAEKRGRFNLGEKLVLAMSREATIRSTKGGVRFNEDGRSMLRKGTERGTVFEAEIKLTADELEDMLTAVRRLIVPPGITTRVNGVELTPRTPVASFEAVLPTEIGDAEGVLRRSNRKARVNVYEPLEGEVGTLYEMGIPVVETGDRFLVDVMMKVPLNFDRDNVTPAYLAQVRALVLDATKDLLTTEDANATWVRDAMQSHGTELDVKTVDRMLELRFGEKRVAYDPGDLEANHRAVAEGYTLIHGRQLSSVEWEAARRAQAVLPAGRVTPTPRPFSPDGKPLRLLARENQGPEMREVVEHLETISERLLGKPVRVDIATDPTWPFAGAYGGGVMVLNAGKMGKAWFRSDNLEAIHTLVLHELAHDKESNHLSDRFHDAICALGARLAVLALKEPELFPAAADRAQPSRSRIAP
jgi:hypothetical protein